MIRIPLLSIVLTGVLFAAELGASGGGGSLVGSSWTLARLAGEEAVGSGPVITLRLEPAGALGGFDGCNQYSGTYSVSGSRIAISPKMARTMMACPDPVEARAVALSRVLAQAASFSIDEDRLSLHDAAGAELAVFTTMVQTLSGTSWEVVSYNNGKEAVVSLVAGTRITLTFGQDGRVTGSAGCNRYFAGYEEGDGTLQISPPAATRRYCGDPAGVMDQETQFLQALQSAVSFVLDGDRLTLRRADGALAVQLARSQPEGDSGKGPDAKIGFDLDRLDAQGLQGSRDGRRALHYEYCVPDRAETVAEVAAIDPTLEVHRGSPGRIGCGAGEVLCLGHTHQAGYLEVLRNLASLAGVQEIREAVFE